MPGGDRTGPMGRGPMTGRAAGYCAGYDSAGYMSSAGGRGGFARRGFGGRGRYGGRRHWYHETGFPDGMQGRGWWGYMPPAAGPMTSDQEIEALREHAAFLEQSIADVKERLGALIKESRSENK